MWPAWMRLRRRGTRSATRFDPLQEFEGLDNLLLRVLASFVIAQGGLSPFAGVGKAARVPECGGCVEACPAGGEKVLHVFGVLDRFAEMTEGQVDLPAESVGI